MSGRKRGLQRIAAMLIQTVFNVGLIVLLVGIFFIPVLGTALLVGVSIMVPLDILLHIITGRSLILGGKLGRWMYGLALWNVHMGLFSSYGRGEFDPMPPLFTANSKYVN